MPVSLVSQIESIVWSSPVATFSPRSSPIWESKNNMELRLARKATVFYDSTKADPAKVKAAIEKAGYRVTESHGGTAA